MKNKNQWHMAWLSDLKTIEIYRFKGNRSKEVARVTGKHAAAIACAATGRDERFIFPFIPVAGW